MWLLLAAALVPSLALAESPEQNDSRLLLHSGWMLQSSCVAKATPAQISARAFRTDGWHSTSVPSTVVAALVADKTYPDPGFGMNLRSIPGTTYPIGANFSLLPMPKDSPFHCSWYYRTEFRFPENFMDRQLSLHFGGINYRANIWLNGIQLVRANEVAGTFRTYDFNVTPLLSSGKPNVLLVQTFAPTERDLAITWVDWNPSPPDKNMGLWREVYLQATGPVTIRYPEVVTHFPYASLAEADLTVIAELHNISTREQVNGWLEGTIEDIHIRQKVTLNPGESRSVRFTPDKFPQLKIENPKLWWPAPLSPQNLHDLSLRFTVGDTVSDAESIRFGIREITSEFNPQGYLLFRVNYKKILIRGAGWTPDMLLRQSPDRLQAEFRYVRDLGLNTLRLEGKLETDDFYNLADEQGILIMAGWSCCDFWEEWDKWKPGQLEIASKSLRSQILRMRSHPSMLVWLNGSDNPPPVNVEKTYINLLKELDWPNPYISSAHQKPSALTGPPGVKMTGPYDYVPPAYWLKDPRKYGGAWGFNTETGPGAAIPLVSSLQKMLPADRLWPVNEYWNFHAASEEFKNTSRFDNALTASYGPPTGLDDYVTKSQAMAYDAERAMFEAYGRNKYTSTGVIQWMLNNAWPSIFWHLYDYYLQPAGGYFGAKKANEPLHVQYSYDDRSVIVVNSLYEKFSGLTLTAELYDLSLQKIFSKQTNLDIDEDAVQRVLTIPNFPATSSSAAYFTRLTLQDAAGKLLSSNFYWLSSKPANIEYSKTLYFGNPAPPIDLTEESAIFTPASPYDDFTALEKLPRVHLAASAAIEKGERGKRVRVKLQNPSDHLAFQIRLGIRNHGDPMEILPVLWDDNYLELMPGESREITAQYLTPDALMENPELTVAGWNIEPLTLPIQSSK
ncbi:MAG: beta galactosidase jelly roll domain-containing protein [Candidatus Acidiferrales bacterium]